MFDQKKTEVKEGRSLVEYISLHYRAFLPNVMSLCRRPLDDVVLHTHVMTSPQYSFFMPE